MKKTLCLMVLVVLLMLAACGAKEAPPPESGSAPASTAPESSSTEEPPEDEAMGEQPVVPIAVDSDEQVEAAVEELIAQYKAGTAEVTENIPALPEGFAFPDQLNWLELEIAFNDVTGAFQATVPSADGKQSAVFVCYKFAQEDGSTKCGVNTVIFH